MSNIVSSVLPKIPAAKVYTCTISPFPYYNGNGQVEFDKVMVAINQPNSGLYKELMHNLNMVKLLLEMSSISLIYP